MNMQTLTKDAQNWLSQHPDILSPLQSSPIKTDASLRTYMRLRGKGALSYIFCQVERHENFQNILTIHSILHDAKVTIPHMIHSKDPYILYEDLGQTHLKTYLTQTRNYDPSILNDCIDQIMNIQNISNDDIPLLPIYQEVVKTKELRDFMQLLKRQQSWDPLEPSINDLLSFSTQKPPVLMHHDYHWENLMVTKGSLRVIDYHDLYWGPPGYDLASLIADRSFYLWSPDTCTALIETFCHHPKNNTQDLTPSHIWALVALRLFKIIGNFDRLSRDVQPSYQTYYDEALKTLQAIPWQTVLSKHLEVKTMLDALSPLNKPKS